MPPAINLKIIKTYKWFWLLVIELEDTVLGPIPLNWESSVFISSIDKSCRYSKHSFPLFSCKQFSIFLIQEAFVGANPPHLIASSIHFESAARTWRIYAIITLKEHMLRNLEIWSSGINPMLKNNGKMDEVW